MVLVTTWFIIITDVGGTRRFVVGEWVTINGVLEHLRQRLYDSLFWERSISQRRGLFAWELAE